MKILFLGDFFFDYDDIPQDFDAICRFVSENGYKVILNLETSLRGYGTPIKKRGPNLASSPKIVDALLQLNVIAVCMANNHTYDFGGEALYEMREQLRNAGIVFCGAGACLDEAQQPAILSFAEKKIILQNFGWDVEETVYASENSPGCAPLEPDYVLHMTAKLRRENKDAFIVNLYHWGFEFNTLPMPRDVQLAHDSIEAGCDLIIGHHPHVVQPKEMWNGRSVYYSLGNFYFGSRRSGFNKAFKNDQVKNMCDYGIGVVYDTENNEQSIVCIEYSKENDQSGICRDSVFWPGDITGIDHLSRSYKRKARLHACNYNPILGVDEVANRRAIIRLYKKYDLINCIKRVMKFEIGSVL